jgi:uncharacterized protein (TIRG00374 family)
MNLKKTVKYILFLAIGVAIFWWVYRDMEAEKLVDQLKGLNYFWLSLSVILGILAHFVRAMRWNLLIHPLGYKPKLHNSFFAVLILYLTNLIIPRAGEISRCTVLAKYENIPATKLIGTVIIERIFDVITLLFFAVIIFFTNLDVFQRFFDTHPEMQEGFTNLLSARNIIILILLAVVGIGTLIFLGKKSNNKIIKKIQKLKNEFFEGMKSVMQLEKKGLFLLETLAIYLIYFLMLYLVFFAFAPTSHLTVRVGMVTFLLSGLAMMVPVQGGIGPWHFMVIESLFIYGISKDDGKVFALIAHTSTNLIFLIVGVIALILLPVFNRNRQQNL